MNHAVPERLLAVARELFARRGYDGTSVRAITTRARANLGAITYHFGSKRALYHKVIEAIAEPFGDLVAAAAAGPGPPLDRIEAIVRSFFAYMEAHPEMPGIMIREMASERPIPPPIARTMQRNVGSLSRVIAQGQSEGSIRPGEPFLLAMSVVAQPMHFALRVRLIERGLGLDLRNPEMRARIVAHALRVTRAMLASQPPAGP